MPLAVFASTNSGVAARRSLRQYDFNSLEVVNSEEEERTMVDKVDDIAKMTDDFVAKVKIPTNMNAAVEKVTTLADDAAAVAKTIAKKYPEGLSKATLAQIKEVEQLRLKDIATYTKKTGDGMRRKITPFKGMEIAPKKYLESHVGRNMQLYGDDGSRLMSSAVVSRSAKDGGGDVLLISSSNPQKNDWLLPKGGWDKGEDIQSAALREVVEEGGVNAKLLHSLGDYKFTQGDKAYTYYAYKMKAGTVYDDWAESVSYEDALKLLAKRPHMVDVVKKAQETDELIKLGKLPKRDPTLATYKIE
ncbi:Nudix hydrolase 21 [Phytophthora citrophthora]|uniref:Nudix hydrolase 21 n=1 Tax=Phytophthora citrophthora TaxID=4793 RepID=A0AAD9GS09_9STRA|nr:Nudix hydrolase 21 [Phytophthora citrophthora]